MNEEELKFIMDFTLDTKNAEKDLKAFMKSMGTAFAQFSIGGKTGLQDASLDKSQMSKLFDFQKEMAKLNEAMKPDTLRLTVKLEEELAKAREKLGKLTEAERQRQAGPVSPTGFGGGFLGGLGATAPGMAQFLKTTITSMGGIAGMVRQLGDVSGTGMVGGALGGGLGLAAGGIGLAVGAAGAAMKTVGKMIAAPAELASYGLRGVANALQGLQGPLGAVGVGFDVLSEGLGKISSVINAIPIVGTILGPFADALVGIPGILKDITGSLVSMSEKASPGQFHLWKMALEDTQGVIGRAFVPVLEIMREGVRLFADMLANFLPSTTEAREALGELRAVFRQMSTELRGVFADIGPTIRGALIEGLRWLGHWAAVAARAIGILAGRLRDYFKAAGITPAGTSDFRSSVGAAARPAAMTGLEEYQRSLQLAAFALPGTGMSDTDKIIQAMNVDMALIDTQAQNLIRSVEEGFKELMKWYGEELRPVLIVVKNFLLGIPKTTKNIGNAYDKVSTAIEFGEEVFLGPAYNTIRKAIWNRLTSGDDEGEEEGR